MMLRWCLETDDRIGMVRDLVSTMARFDSNVEAMEVLSGVMYVRLSCQPAHLASLRSALLQIDGVKRIETIESLPYEADEQNLCKRAFAHTGGVVDAKSFSGIIYESDLIMRLVHVVKTIASQDVPVLITGESGTGKELMARAIHDNSAQKSRRFVPVNCAAIPENLLDSELFGYVEGAFTGAKRGGRLGLFEVADGGTLFLDEIGEMNPAVQAKLLRVLSEGEVRRVGDTVERKVHVRIIAATNRKLEQLIETGQFRADLYYRLNVIPIHIPPLRERREDILPLARSFIASMESRLERHFVVPPETEAALWAYHFPGNVRELRNMIERACYLAEGEQLVPDVFMFRDAPNPANVSLSADSSGVSSSSRASSLSPSIRRFDSESRGNTVSLTQQVRAFERQVIESTVEHCGSIRKAARQLGVSHTTLLNKLRADGKDAGDR